MNRFYVLLVSLLSIFSLATLACTLNPGYEGYNKDKAKGEPVTAGDPAPGLKLLTPTDALNLIENDKYVFIDTRPERLYQKCKIKNSKLHPYAIPGDAENTLTQEIVKGYIDAGKTVVFYCNALKCYRGLNAAIQACQWGIPTDKIIWLAEGVPGVVAAAGDKLKKYTDGKGCVNFTE